ncbi:DUF6461 domain-containing protein [Streptomyces sp. NPDC020141]|uniref:DUF6461 domain-containing protein n=1 Tax=Streptomyces sp. NPDC020141 TaxID=3365065 RepID=UPI0037952628
MTYATAADYSWTHSPSSPFGHARGAGYSLVLVRGIDPEEVLRRAVAEPEGVRTGFDALVEEHVGLAFLTDRTRVLHGLGERLRSGGALVVITPTTADVPKDRRDIALDEDEIALLTEGWEKAERLDADGLTVMVLRGPSRPAPGRWGRARPDRRPGRRHRQRRPDSGRALRPGGMWELPGGKSRGAEGLGVAAVREPVEDM